MDTERARVPVWLWVLLALLITQRLVYHLSYLRIDPFALVTIADGQLYEAAARDILAHPPLGTQPLYLQGLYAYLVAAGFALGHGLPGALCLQLLTASIGLALFALAAWRSFGARAGALSLAVLLATPSVAFYENKPLSVSLGLTTCMALLWAFARVLDRPQVARALMLGACTGLAILGRPNIVLAAPFVLFALWLAADEVRAAKLLAAATLGCMIALAPLALRNLAVTGQPTILPSHGGGIPFYIGNNPSANGRWNDAGGLLSGQVWHERRELAQRLGIDPHLRGVERAIGAALYARAFAFIRDQPGAFAALELKKLWYTLGNHAFVRDYDLLGERELLGAAHPIGLPFGCVLACGALGLGGLARTARAARKAPAEDRNRWRPQRAAALLTGLSGLMLSVLAANLLWFTSAQNRAPLIIPLAFVSGPALLALWSWGRARQPWRAQADGSHPAAGEPAPTALAVICAALLGAQAFVPRLSTARPSSTHYYNLANAEEALGRHDAALEHYALASERNPKQPMFWWRRAHLARRTGRIEEARYALRRMTALPDLSPELRRAAERERSLLATGH